jgi:hypothetical protein
MAKLLVSKLAIHAHCDLGSQLDPGENPNSPADLIGPLAHSLETPTSIPPVCQVPRINAATVIAHGNAQLSWPKLNERLNVLRAGVAVSIDNSFAANAIHFMPHHRPQFVGPAIYGHSKSNRRVEAQFIRNRREGLAQRSKVLLR